MDTRVLLQPAYLLHSRPFQNTSLLVDFFCLDYGCVTAVARGARREKSKYRALLQLFQPLLVSFSGRGEVKTVNTVESSLGAIQLKGERLFSGMYLNELLTRLLHDHIEHRSLYNAYQDALVLLQGESDMQPVLRRFELALLSELGYAVNLQFDCHSHVPIESGILYRFIPDVGFSTEETTEVTINESANSKSANVFRGEHLLALQKFEFPDVETSRSAKRLLRIALAAHLGDKPLNSRSLFASTN